MKSNMMYAAAAIGCVAIWAGVAHAQSPIERVKMTDNEMSCAQIYSESKDMDKVISDASSTQSNSQGAQVAAGVANQAAATGLFSGFARATPFGGILGQAVAQGAQQAASNTAQAASERSQQATARKQQLTSMFLGKGCKMGEVQASNAPAATPAPAQETPKTQ